MMDVTVSSPERARWTITSAVLVYEATGGSGSATGAYATLHSVETNGRRLRLGSGQPASKQACATLARALGAASTLSGFLPPDMLYLGARTIVWWRRPSPATMYFDTTKTAAGDQREDKTHAHLIGKRAGRTPQPGLVFAVTPSDWFVYAVKGQERPAPDTALFRAPYFNVWTKGKICTGNVRLPDTLSTSSLERYERAFFDSEFTHPNVRAGERLLIHPAGSYTFWRELLDRPAEAPAEFPEAALVETKLTLEGLARRLDKENGGDDE